MPRYVALLRAVNVGGRTVTMARLAMLFSELGFRDVETFIASGNVAFTATRSGPAVLERRIAAHLGSALGFEVPAILRTPDELAAVAERQPFGRAAHAAAAADNVAFLATEPTAAAVRQVLALATPQDRLLVRGREVHWLATVRQSASPVTNARIERAAGTTATMRSASSIAKMAARFAG